MRTSLISLTVLSLGLTFLVGCSGHNDRSSDRYSSSYHDRRDGSENDASEQARYHQGQGLHESGAADYDRYGTRYERGR